MHDSGEVVGRINGRGLVPATRGLHRGWVLLAELQPPLVERRLYVLGREGLSVVPLHAVAKLPGHRHRVAADLDVPVLDRWNLGGELRLPVVGDLRVLRHVGGRFPCKQAFHYRVCKGDGVRGAGSDGRGQQAVLLLPGGYGDLATRRGLSTLCGATLTTRNTDH